MLNNKLTPPKFATKNRETILPTKTAIYLDYLVAVLLFAIATIIFLTLMTYNPNDDCWFHIADSEVFYNKLGIIGAYCSDLVFSLFGFSAWWLFIGVFYLGYRKLIRTKIVIGSLFNIFQIICFILLVIMSAITESIYFLPKQSFYLHNNYGGMIGNIFKLIIPSTYYNLAVIITFIISCITFILAFRISIVDLVELVGLVIEKIFLFVKNLIKKFMNKENEENNLIKDSSHNMVDLDINSIPDADNSSSKSLDFELNLQNTFEDSDSTNDTSPKFSFPIKEAVITISDNNNNNNNEEVVVVDNLNNNSHGDNLTKSEKLYNPINNKNHTYKLPQTDLLTIPKKQTEVISAHTIDIISTSIQNKLAEFGVEAKITEAQSGPVVTRYEILPSRGVRGEKIVNLGKEIARGLALSNVRIVETIPGKNTMGIEVPNFKRQIIYLKEIFDAVSYKHSASKLTLALGKDIAGNVIVADLAKMPHLLVAGTTGSGKSVAVNVMILSILFQAHPSEVKFIMIDPKMVELSFYHDIPHLLAPVITDTNYAVNALKWTVAEMEKRYRIMAKVGCKNIVAFNQKIDEANYSGKHIKNPITLTPDNPENLDKWPYIVVIIDELADLMMSSGKKIEQYIVRIAQKARAVGIHLIVATQRPSVDVITGLIKANIPTRISFQVTSKIDSRTILDQGGAETLLGQGDMLYLQPGSGAPQRVHGAFVNDDEVNKVVTYLKQHGGNADYIEDIISGEFDGSDTYNLEDNQENNEKDSVFDEAVKFIYDSKRCSISSLQTRFGIGYNRAARIMSHLESIGMVKRNERGGFELLNKTLDNS
jgi:S-DNA-T family DNA segregation ATPase FtsK/SpoIIIE